MELLQSFSSKCSPSSFQEVLSSVRRSQRATCVRVSVCTWYRVRMAPPPHVMSRSLLFFWQNFGIYLELCHHRPRPPVCRQYSFIVTDDEQPNWLPRGSHSDVAVSFRTNYCSAFSFVVKQFINFTLQDENTRSFETLASKTSKTRRHFPGGLKFCQKIVGSFVGKNFHDHPVVCAVGVRLLEHPAGR